MDVRMEPVISTNMHSLGYDATKRKLYVRFKNSKALDGRGNLYEYDDVPSEIHKSIREAASKGTMFSRLVKGKFVFRKVEEDGKTVN